MRKMLGEELAVTIPSSRELLGIFNSILENKVLLGVEDRFFADDRGAVGRNLLSSASNEASTPPNRRIAQRLTNGARK